MGAAALQSAVAITENASQAIADIGLAAARLAAATCRVQELEDDRALVKARCIKAMIGTPNPLGKEGALHSASSAKDVVEEHPDYMAHRGLQAEAETDRILGWATYEAAKLRAQLQVGLANAAALSAARE